MRLVLACLALIGFVTVAQAEGGELWPSVPAATGNPHPEGSEYWRKHHMQMMLRDRDLTLRHGEREEIQASIGTCFDCHAVKDESGEAVSFDSPKHFCRVCHDYAAVEVDCFMCHRSTPDPDPEHRAMARPEDPNSIAAYLARLEAEGVGE